jgi:hypothetical protein
VISGPFALPRTSSGQEIIMGVEMPSIRRARELLARARRDGVGRGYPDGVRQEVVLAVGEARARGSSLTGLSNALALPLTTLSRWLPEPGLVQVQIAEVPAGSRSGEALVVELGSGLRILGLTLDGVVALHRRLS